MSTIYVYFSFVTCDLVFFLRNHSLSQGYIPHANFPMSCIILVITLSSLIYFESIIYMWRDVGVQFHAFSWGYPVVLVLFVESIIFPSLNYSGILVRNQLTGNVRIYSATLHSIPWNSVSVHICWNHTVSWGAALGHMHLLESWSGS